MEAFAELGYARASARELAKRLGVNHNFINDRYGSKATFWRAVLDEAMRWELAQRREILDADLDDEQRVRAVVELFYRASVRTPLLARLLADEFCQESERLDYFYDHYLAPTLTALQPAVERLAAAGRIPATPPDVLFFALISPVAGLVQTPLATRLGREQPLTREVQERAARRLAQLVLDGLFGAR